MAIFSLVTTYGALQHLVIILMSCQERRGATITSLGWASYSSQSSQSSLKMSASSPPSDCLRVVLNQSNLRIE